MTKFNTKTGILFLITLSEYVSGLPFDNERVSDNYEFDDVRVQKFLTRLQRAPDDNEEGSIESRFGGGSGHFLGGFGSHGFRQYPPQGHWHQHAGYPVWGGGYEHKHGPHCNHDQGYSQGCNHYGHSPEYHQHGNGYHNFGYEDHHNCNHGTGEHVHQNPQNEHGGNTFPMPQSPQNTENSSVDSSATPSTGPTTDKATPFPNIDIRLGV